MPRPFRSLAPAAAAAVAALALVALVGPGAGAADEDAKREDIRKLIRVTGAIQSSTEVVDQIIASFKQNMRQVPAEFWEEFRKEIDPRELEDMIVPIYDKHLAHEDVKALIAFYETPSGKKFAAAQPKIASESFNVGQAWGMKIGQKVVERLKERELAKRAKGNQGEQGAEEKGGDAKGAGEKGDKPSGDKGDKPAGEKPSEKPAQPEPPQPR